MENKKWAYSFNGEEYNGCYNSYEECLDDAKLDNYEHQDIVYIGTCTEPTLIWCSCEDYIIDSICENLYDQVGEYADFEPTDEQELDLAKRIDKCVEQWINDWKIKPNCYTVLDGKEVKI